MRKSTLFLVDIGAWFGLLSVLILHRKRYEFSRTRRVESTTVYTDSYSRHGRVSVLDVTNWIFWVISLGIIIWTPNIAVISLSHFIMMEFIAHTEHIFSQFVLKCHIICSWLIENLLVINQVIGHNRRSLLFTSCPTVVLGNRWSWFCVLICWTC